MIHSAELIDVKKYPESSLTNSRIYQPKENCGFELPCSATKTSSYVISLNLFDIKANNK